MYQKYRNIIFPVALFGIAGLMMLLFFNRFKLSPDLQEYRCLDQWLFLVDKSDKDLKKGHMVAFHHKEGAKKIPKGIGLIKILRGVSGDRIKVTENYTEVNGVRFDISMTFGLKVLEDEAAIYEREFIVPEGHYFFMGTTKFSNDSRFWGTIAKEQVVGRSYAIL